MNAVGPTRRRLVLAALGGGFAYVAHRTVGSTRRGYSLVASPSEPHPDHNSPGPPPTRGTLVVRDRLVLDRDLTVDGVRVEPGGELIFHPGRSVTLTTTGNVIVRGLMRMAPGTASRRHTLRFIGIDESRFHGGMTLSEHDVGLWVRDRGRLVLDGAERTPWLRAAGGLRQGQTRLRLKDAPVGWRRGDTLVVAPTAPPTEHDHFDQYDTVRVVEVSGTEVTVSRPLRFDHPAVRLSGGRVIGAEVMNLSRNVRIQGTPRGRTHVHITSTARQHVRYALIRHVGPRQQVPGEGFTAGVLGRYGLHFHMVGNSSRGTVVEGVVVRDAGSHAFVPHASHGITFRHCVSHNTMDAAYWWDAPEDNRGPQFPSNGVQFDRCVASRVTVDPPFRGFRLTGFNLGHGAGCIATRCIAVGVQGNQSASGFFWPEKGHGDWKFDRCVAHNNAVDGIYVWQNRSDRTDVTRFLAYHNGKAGIEHGAYLNRFAYQNCHLHGNGFAAVVLHALSASTPMRFSGVVCDGAGVSDFGIATVRHTLPSTVPVVVERGLFTRHRIAALGLLATEGAPDRLDLIDNTVQGVPVYEDAHWVGGTVRWS